MEPVSSLDGLTHVNTTNRAMVSFSLYCDIGSRARTRIYQTTPVGLAKHLSDVHVDIVSCRGSSCRSRRSSLCLCTSIGTAAEVAGHLLVQLLLRLLRSRASPTGLSVLTTSAAVSSLATSLATSARTTTPTLSPASRHGTARVTVLTAALAGHVAVYISARGQRSRPRNTVGQRFAWHVRIVKGVAPRGRVHNAEADGLS